MLNSFRLLMTRINPAPISRAASNKAASYHHHHHNKSPNKSSKYSLNKNSNLTFSLTSLNDGRGGAKREFKIPVNRQNSKFIFNGRSDDQLMGRSQDDEMKNPEEMFELEKDLDMFTTNENLFHGQIIQEDIKKV